ncbi:MAG: NAD+ synthase [Rhodospirillales bacterium]|nr:NAD+ synthase [Rhodospirillales bacterium]
MKIALAQINPTVGDIIGNLAKIRTTLATATADGADLVVFSELVTSGYPPEDLVRKPAFLDRLESEVKKLATETTKEGPALLIGTPWRHENKVFNGVLLLANGVIQETRFKIDLPNYGVFDEKRVFDAGETTAPISFKGTNLGILVCEDMWTPAIAASLKKQGAELLISLNGSPFEIDKSDQRRNHANERVKETGLPLIYVNQVGGQDELTFDGASFVLNADGKLIAQTASWREDYRLTDWANFVCTESKIEAHPVGLEAIYQAMTVGLRDYVNKNGFPGVLLGLSGGIDSAISAAVAVDALGSDRVHCVMMPSPYTSKESLEDAELVAKYLGTQLDTVSIEPAMEAFGKALEGLFGNTEHDTTEENIQSRSRGLILMGLSNKFGKMLLTTGNKSEMSVGYATLYGDMCGGYSVLKDVYKITAFELSSWRNQNKPEGALGPDGLVMPERVITKPPSAELKPDQKDEDSLPPYEVLDDVLHSMIEEEKSVEEIVAKGHDEKTVRRVWRMLDRTEYKRRQAPPGVKLTFRAFGRDRRYPITNGFTKLI